jgi:hypothetical protein
MFDAGCACCTARRFNLISLARPAPTPLCRNAGTYAERAIWAMCQNLQVLTYLQRAISTFRLLAEMAMFVGKVLAHSTGRAR